MTVSRSSPKKVRLSLSVSVSSEQSCILGTRPTTFLNFGSSQDVSQEQPRDGCTFGSEEKRKSKSSSPPRRRRDVPDIIISDVGDVNAKWTQLAEEIQETSWKAKQKEKKKRAKKARRRWRMIIGVARAGIKFSWWAYASLNLPVKPVMNEARALAALQFDNLKEVDDEDHWANILSTKFLSRLYHLEHVKCLIVVGMESGKLFKIPRKKGKVYDFDMVSHELCDIHEAFQYLRKKFIDLYGDISPRLAEEDKKIFDLWMENWIEQRQNDFFFSFGNLDSLKTKAISNPVCPFT